MSRIPRQPGLRSPDDGEGAGVRLRHGDVLLSKDRSEAEGGRGVPGWSWRDATTASRRSRPPASGSKHDRPRRTASVAPRASSSVTTRRSWWMKYQGPRRRDGWLARCRPSEPASASTLPSHPSPGSSRCSASTASVSEAERTWRTNGRWLASQQTYVGSMAGSNGCERSRGGPPHAPSAGGHLRRPQPDLHPSKARSSSPRTPKGEIGLKAYESRPIWLVPRRLLAGGSRRQPPSAGGWAGRPRRDPGLHDHIGVIANWI